MLCGLVLGFAPAAFSQSAPPASALTVSETARVTAPRTAAQPAQRPRPNDARDRAFMDGGMAFTPGFAGGVMGSLTAPTPRAELAPRPDRDIELRPNQPSLAPTLMPTMIHPALPSRGAAAEGVASQTERRFLQNPAPGARLNVPMIW